MAPEFDNREWRTVRVPHTWQIEPQNAAYYGVAWYRRTFDAPGSWAAGAVRIEFEAVFHTATVWVNGKMAGEHIGKGYTAFTCEIGSLLSYGALNALAVRVDNAYRDSMLLTIAFKEGDITGPVVPETEIGSNYNALDRKMRG